jgi:hypothetical protein
MDSELDAIFASKEIPFQDSLVITKFHTDLKETLGLLYPNQNSYSQNEIKAAIKTVLGRDPLPSFNS